MKVCSLLPRTLLVTAIKAIKHLSTSPQLIEVLQNSNAMEVLVTILGKSMKGAHSNVSSRCAATQSELTLSGDLLAHLSNNIFHVPVVQGPAGRGSFLWDYPVVAKGHPRQVALEAICSAYFVRPSQCWQSLTKITLAQ